MPKFSQAVPAMHAYMRALEEELHLGPGDAFQRDGMEAEQCGQRTSWLLAGMAVICDWIGSDTEFFPFEQEEMSLATYWESYAIPQARRAVGGSRLLCAQPGPPFSFGELFPGFRPTQAQATVGGIALADGPSLHLIEAPTGSGKTESALFLAHRLISSGVARGLYFALPTQATANAMEARIRPVAPRLIDGVDAEDVVLAHGARRIARWLASNASADGEYGRGETTASTHRRRWVSDNLKKALLAPVGVGTIDQALLAVLPVRHQSLRLFGLASKVLIVDEVHASDHYVHRLLCALLEHHAALGGSAILLSATLPDRMRREMVNAFQRGLGLTTSEDSVGADYPLLTTCASDGAGSQTLPSEPNTSRQLTLRYVSEEEGVLGQLAAAVEAGQCACWIRNTVDDCLTGAARLAARLPNESVQIFHARFPLGRRLEIEGEVLRNFGPTSGPGDRRGRVLVATQVVEQSLDLDFDVLASDLAPIDLLIQRAGRVRRHRRDASGERIDSEDERGEVGLTVFGPSWSADPSSEWFSGLFPRGAYVYPQVGELWRTARLLQFNTHLRLPEECQEWMGAVFEEDASPPLPDGLIKGEDEALANGMGQAGMANLNALRRERGYVAEQRSWSEEGRAPTRLGEETVMVRFAKESAGAVESLLGEGEIGWFLSEWRAPVRLIAVEPESMSTACIEEVKQSMPDEGRYVVLVILKEQNPDVWGGEARCQPWPDSPLLPIYIRYTPTEGLRFSREEGFE